MSIYVMTLDKHYENYRRGIIERHLCQNGRFLQDVLLDKETKEVVYVDEHGQKKVVGGGDNPFLYGGLMMAVFSIEHMRGVSKHSLRYATKLLEYFVNNDIMDFKRKKNWWREYKSLSKDELSGLILGLYFYIIATLGSYNDFGKEYRLARTLLNRIAIYLDQNNFKPAGSWLFRHPFSQMFKRFSGEPYNFTKWYDKYIFRWTMRALPLVYTLASIFKIKRNFYNIAMYTHCLWMIYLTSQDTKGDRSAYNKLYKFFCTKGWKPYQGQEIGNNYIELTQNVINKDGSLTEHKWNEELPNCLPEGPPNDYIGECFTWEHPNSSEHNLEYDWGKVLWRLGPSNKQQLDDMNKEFIVESCGLGLLFVRALAYYKGMCDPPVLKKDNEFNTLPLDGAY